ncbi:hypothetical protein CC86DRAFT_412452 [Ophiobolus disseminans]|uniref:BTB domain-containing protein n=1 Tax=Ophiobolus disseminans TaxID=1469910 RepID=A0A6A6ZGX2_9PLEO|nr:hypothetical protein CC86DRAFT_412452 [Ophiobolus disseminans]
MRRTHQHGGVILVVGKSCLSNHQRANSIASILRSEQFTSLIGPDDEPFVVHSGIIAKLSAPLERLVNGLMKKAHKKVARLPDLEPSDFERLCEFAYSGEYTAPEKTLSDEDDLNIKVASCRISDSIATYKRLGHDSRLARCFMEKGFGRRGLAFHPLYVCLGMTTEVKLDHDSNGWTKPGGSDSDDDSWKEDISQVLLGHARLYVFAKKYLIPELGHLALHKLH